MLQSVPVMMSMCMRHLVFLWLVKRNMVVSTSVPDQAACDQELKRTCVDHACAYDNAHVTMLLIDKY